MDALDKSLWQAEVPDAIIVVDDQGVIVKANERVETLLGWRPDELLGKRVETLVPERFREHISYRGRFQAAPEERGMGSGLDLVALHRSGLEVPVDIALRPHSVGLARYVIASVRDASASRSTIEDLTLKAIALDEAANGIVITDAAGVIQWVNAAVTRMTGYAAAELVGRNPRMLKSGLQDDSYYAEMWTTITAGDIWQGTIINRRKDGRHYHEEQTISPVHGPAGGSTHFIAVKQDVTARVLAEEALRDARDEIARQFERLQQVDAVKTTLLHALSHDLRGLLATVIGSAATLELGLDRMSEADLRSMIGGIDRSSQRMMSILNDLLDLDRLDRGIVEPLRNETDLVELVLACVERFEEERSRIVVESVEPVKVLVDPAQIERIVENLLGNALKYSPAGSKVVVDVTVEPTGALLTVSDAGPGIPEEMREAVFESYRRGREETVAGLGIGLSLVRRFAELNGGRAWVEGRDGGGASFKVFLPSA